MNLLWDKTLEFLVSTIGQSAVDSWRNGSPVDSYLSNLRAALPKARLLIERSECWRLPKYNPIDELLSQLKDSVYEAESIVDELEYRRLKNEVEKGFPGINFLRDWMRDFPKTVKRVLERLNHVYDEMKVVCDIRGIPENPNQFIARPITSRFLNTSKVCGRDKEFNKVIRLMGVPSYGSGQRKRAKNVRVSNLEIGESSSRMDKKQNVSVLSIVGMGGVGKTTLAQKVINDNNVKSHFDHIMWVCVSDNLDLVRLTKEMIESATGKKSKLTNLDKLQNDLQEKLNSKRFLLVLDDVWSKDWQDLLAPMEEASEGSVVLVTTRSLQCVETPGTSISLGDVMNLVGLEEDIYWVFFKSCAFHSVAESNNINPELEDIGKEICKRLKGSPLAAKTIGGVLGTNLDVRHWRNIKDSEMWRIQKDERDILPVLQLSYQYLPSHLKKCFSFCSLYPKDFNFTQSELTQFWIMQGLVKPIDNAHQMRTLAEGYFFDLVKRCFFQKLPHSPNSVCEDKYVIHDLMHDVCQSITKDECFCLENENSEHKVSFDIRIRHVSVYQKKLKKKESELSKYKKLLSLKVAYTNICSIAAMENWCNDLTNIRSLSLSRCKIKELPENIGNLKHLQYLDISGTNIETLPESFCSLYNLQYLNMNDCPNIECFPEGFNNLVNLLLLELPLEKVSLVEHIENIFEAIQLYDLSVNVTREKIENLKNICKLNGALYIFELEKVPSKEAAEQAQLNMKPLINHLSLCWSIWRQSGDQSVSNENLDEEVLHGLCPHPNLKRLKINGYAGRNLSPSWLKKEFLPNLTEIWFDCMKASTLSHLPCSITNLKFKNCDQLTSLQNCLEPNHLPALKWFEISSCCILKSLPVESFGGFVSLEYLEIQNCSNLRCPNAMVLPPSIKVLKLGSCGELQNSIPSCLQNLTSLETLWIRSNTGLVSIPAEITSNLKSLLNLYLWDCDMLQSLGGLQFLASLHEVTIIKCPKLVETRGQNIRRKLPSELLELLEDSGKEGQEGPEI
ncbi:putative disease resistance protein RGA3 [Carex rostrata]